MENQKKYLLANTPESKKQIENIIILLKTGEIANVRLALQLMETGGVPDKVWTYLIAIFWTDVMTYEENDLIQDFMQKYTPKNFQHQIEYIYVEGFNQNNDDFTDLFEDENYTFPEIINKHELANQILLLGNYNRESIARYCQKYNTIAPQKLLKAFLNQDYLNLSGLNLDFLPKEIKEFSQITSLNLVGNNFTEVPDEIAQLKNLKYIYGIDSLPEKTIAKLKDYFPKVFAKRKLEEASNLRYSENYKEALVEVNESLELDASNSNAHAWYMKGFILHKLERYEEELEITFQGLDTPDLDNLWKARLYFRKGQGYFYLERFKEAENAYNEALALFPKYDTAIYNKACVYAKWHQKEKLLHFLKQAIKLDTKFIKVAQEDTDFQEYWEDVDFIELLKMNEN